jgi:hypothetical protein
MIIRKSDFTVHAIELGMWETLCEMAGLDSLEDSGLPSENDEIELDITKVKQFKYKKES